MNPLDLRTRPPRGPRETMLGFYFLPRTVDKLRAELPGGNIGEYLNHDAGFSAYVVRRLGLDMNEFRDAVASASDEAAVVAWLAPRLDAAFAPTLNAKLDTFVVERMSPDDQALMRRRHPVMASRPDLTKLLDVLEADDARVTIGTRDGSAPALLFRPEGVSGPWPAIIVYTDAFGIRPASEEMGRRLAEGGYLVLLPDLFYRSGPSAPMIPAEVLGDPKRREALMQRLGSLDRDAKVSDTRAFIEFLSAHPEVRGDRFGVTGYCFGGNASLTAAGAFGDRFAAVASFHGGHLATDDPESPHRFVADIRGRVYVAGAVEDASFPEDQKERLEEALAQAGVDHIVTTYEGAHHGFAVPDHPAYNPEAAERHWRASFELFSETLH
jgi:carboxymethylenebutenolidase